VRQIQALANLRDFERLLWAASLKTGQQLNKSILAREVGVSITTIGEWLSVLHLAPMKR
jgi:DNA-binding GntR family transcriptional regulator